MEYFITYHRIKYPACRKADALDTGIVREQRRKTCFTPKACPDNRFNTVFVADFYNIEENHLKCPNGYHDTCPNREECKGKRPFICIRSDCRESILIEDCRCSVGELTGEAKTIFEKKTEIQGKQADFANKLPGFTFCSKEEIDLSGIDAKIDHGKLIGLHDKSKSSHSGSEYIRYMEECQHLAKIIRDEIDNQPNTDTFPSLEDQFYKEALEFPPLPIDGKSNDDWMILSEFSKLIGKSIKDIKVHFAPIKNPIKISVGQSQYGKCTAGYMAKCIWGQMPPDMKSHGKETGYFILKASISTTLQSSNKRKSKKA